MTTGLADLAASADILLHDLGPTAAAARGLAYDELAARSPRLVVCSITPFGMTGPYADYAADELTVIHGCSWGFLTPSASTRIDLPPLKAFGHHATLQTATVAAAAALAAFDRAERLGVGDHVDFSVYAAGAKMSETAPASASFQGADSSRVGVKSVVPWGIYECRDGLIQFICVEEAQWRSLVRLMGEPEWATMEIFATLADRRENADLVELYLSEWMAEQKVDELYQAGQAARLCMSPVYDMAGLSRDAQLAARGFFAETPDGLRVTGAGFQVDQPWWALRRAAPERGQHDGEGWAPRAEPDGAAAPRRRRSPPLRPYRLRRRCPGRSRGCGCATSPGSGPGPCAPSTWPTWAPTSSAWSPPTICACSAGCRSTRRTCRSGPTPPACSSCTTRTSAASASTSATPTPAR